MLVCKLKGGLGNQMFQYAAARALSIRSGRRLAIDAYTGFQLDKYGRQYALGDFAVSAPTLSAQEAKQAAAHTYIRTRLIREIENIFKNRFGYGHVGVLLRVISLGGLYLDGYWQSEKYFSDSADVIRSEFTCTRTLCETSRSLLSQIKATESVSVHIRRKDYPLLCPESYYRAALRQVYRQIDKPTFFFFGDDKSWIESLIAHLEIPFPCLSVQSPGSDLDEFELMRACKHHIIANSTFGWWAAWLSDSAQVPHHVIVAPATGWSSTRSLVADMVPGRWVALPDPPGSMEMSP
jgi:hypothetical protein